MPGIVIEIDTDLSTELERPLDSPHRHKAYFKQRTDGTWYAVSDSGIPMSLSNYTTHAAGLAIALENAQDADAALEAAKGYCYTRFAIHARIYRDPRYDGRAHGPSSASEIPDVIICYRDPDSSNEYRTFLAPGRPEPIIVDVDYGYADLRDREEFEGWAESLTCIADSLYATGQEDAAESLRATVREARNNYGHEVELFQYAVVVACDVIGMPRTTYGLLFQAEDEDHAREQAVDAIVGLSGETILSVARVESKGD